MVLMKVLASRVGRVSCEIDATGAGAGCSPVFGGAEAATFCRTAGAAAGIA